MYREQEDRKNLAKAHIRLKNKINDNRTLRNLAMIFFGSIWGILALISPSVFGMSWLDSAITFGSMGALSIGSTALLCHKSNKALYQSKTGLNYSDYLEAERTKKLDDYVNELSIEEIDKASKSIEPSGLYKQSTELTPDENKKEQTKLLKALSKKLARGKDINALETKIINDEANFNFGEENTNNL